MVVNRKHGNASLPTKPGEEVLAIPAAAHLGAAEGNTVTDAVTVICCEFGGICNC